MEGTPYRTPGYAEQVEAHSKQLAEQQKTIDKLQRDQSRMQNESRVKNGILFFGGTLMGLALNAHDVQTSTSQQVAATCDFVDAQGGAAQDEVAQPEPIASNSNLTLEASVQSFLDENTVPASTLLSYYDLQGVQYDVCNVMEEPEPIVWMNGSFQGFPNFPGDTWIHQYPFVIREEENPEIRLELIPTQLVQ